MINRILGKSKSSKIRQQALEQLRKTRAQISKDNPGLLDTMKDKLAAHAPDIQDMLTGKPEKAASTNKEPPLTDPHSAKLEAPKASKPISESTNNQTKPKAENVAPQAQPKAAEAILKTPSTNKEQKQKSFDDKVASFSEILSKVSSGEDEPPRPSAQPQPPRRDDNNSEPVSQELKIDKKKNARTVKRFLEQSNFSPDFAKKLQKALENKPKK